MKQSPRARQGTSPGKGRWFLFLMLVLAALLVSACGAAIEKVAEESIERAAESAGGGDVEIDVSEEGASVQAEVEGEDFSVDVGSEVEIPDGLVIPMPDGGNVTMSGNQGSYVFVTAQFPPDEFDRIVGFYEDWTSGDAREWQRSESSFSSDQGTSRHVQWLSDASTIAIDDCMTLSTDEPDAVCLTVNQSG